MVQNDSPLQEIKRVNHPALSKVAITTVITVVIAISRDRNVIKKEVENIYKTKTFQ